MPIYQAGSDIWSINLIDVNGDGVLDIITANNISNDVSVLIGNGNGTFQPQSTFPAGVGSGAAALADFNGDGKVDIATANNNRAAAPGSVSVLLNQGSGQFGAATSFPTGTDPIDIAAVDLNLDGRIDLVTADSVANTLSVLLGNGDGSFQSPRPTLSDAPGSLAVADFNEDGKPDVVTANQRSMFGGSFVSVFLGNGDGTLQERKVHIPHQPTNLAVGDFNGDGHADIAGTEYFSNEFFVLLGRGDGTFQTALSAPLQAPYGLAVGDVDHDSRPDLIIAGFGTSKINLVLGNGDGTFQIPHGYDVQGEPISVAIGDINGDGTPDIAAGAGAGSSVWVLLSPAFTLQVAPVAHNGSASGNEDIVITGTLSASDPDSESLLFSVVTPAGHGTVTVNGDGSFSYMPNADYNGLDAFTFKANDGLADSNTATENLTVNAVNDAPLAANGSSSGNENTVITGTLAATDSDSASLTFSGVAQAAHGTVMVNANGSFSYTPNANYFGTDSFTFKANDGSLDSNVATVSLTIEVEDSLAPPHLPQGSGLSAGSDFHLF